MSVILPEASTTLRPTRPIWAEPTPDPEGNHDGPTWRVGRLNINVHTAWNERDGAVMWMDSSLYALTDLRPEEADYLAAGLTSAGRLVREATAQAERAAAVTR